MGKGRKTLVLVIAKLRKKYTLKALLNYTKLAKSTYYDALKKLSREDKYKGLKTLIHNICNKNHGRYGYRRVTMQLHKQGIKINHKVVMRLMKEENLTCKVRAKKYKSYRGQEGKVAKNILNRNFKAEKPIECNGNTLILCALLDNEVRSQQIQEARESEQIPVTGTVEQNDSTDAKVEQIPAAQKEDYGVADFNSKYQPDASYDLKGVDSDISKLDVEKALSDLKKDQVLQQYQFFVGDDAFASTEKLKQVREEENFWL